MRCVLRAAKHSPRVETCLTAWGPLDDDLGRVTSATITTGVQAQAWTRHNLVVSRAHVAVLQARRWELKRRHRDDVIRWTASVCHAVDRRRSNPPYHPRAAASRINTSWTASDGPGGTRRDVRGEGSEPAGPPEPCRPDPRTELTRGSSTVGDAASEMEQGLRGALGASLSGLATPDCCIASRQDIKALFAQTHARPESDCAQRRVGRLVCMRGSGY